MIVSPGLSEEVGIVRSTLWIEIDPSIKNKYCVKLKNELDELDQLLYGKKKRRGAK